MMTIIFIIVCHHSLLTFLKSMMNQTAVVFKNPVKALYEYEGNHYGFLSDTGITWLIILSGRERGEGDRPRILGTQKPLFCVP
jgi:hypothetical protein